MSLKDRFRESGSIETGEELGSPDVFKFSHTTISSEDVGSWYKFKPEVINSVTKILEPIAAGFNPITQTAINLLSAIIPGYTESFSVESIDTDDTLEKIKQVVRAYTWRLQLTECNFIAARFDVEGSDLNIVVRKDAVEEVV